MINGGFVAIPFSKKNSDQAGIKEGFIEGEDFGELIRTNLMNLSTIGFLTLRKEY